MIPVTVMVTGKGTVSHRIKGRFGPGNPSRFSSVFRPVIVWNMTYACNLRCIHCYINAGEKCGDELSYEESLDLIDQIAEVSSPLLILSGGEPLLRKDFIKIAEYAADKGLRLALSTNGVLITKEIADQLKSIGFMYIGVSIDSPNPSWHDMFRGVKGSFDKAMEGIHNSIKAGLPTGIRYTITRYNVSDASKILDLAVENGIMRVTFYHLTAAGRAQDMNRDWYLTPEQYRWFMDLLIESAKKYSDILEIETTLSPFDGIYIADKIAEDEEEFWTLMDVVKAQGGCGRKIISIYPDGTVYPCQFVDFFVLGNVRENRLKDILSPDHPALEYFSNTESYLRQGKCHICPFNHICKGGDRIRAYYLGGSIYADDPQCHIDVEEIYRRWAS